MAEQLFRSLRREAAAAREDVFRAVLRFDAAAGKNVEAAEKAHRVRPPRQQHLERAALIGPHEQHRRGVFWPRFHQSPPVSSGGTKPWRSVFSLIARGSKN